MYSFLLLNFYMPIILLLAKCNIYNSKYTTVEDSIWDNCLIEYQPNSSVLSALKDLTSI